MRHFPIYLDMAGARVVVSGAGETAVAKLRLLLKTEADIAVFGPNPAEFVRAWAGEGRLRLTERPLEASNLDGVRLLYAANDDEAEDARVRLLGRSAGVLVNVVDNLNASDFITPAIVDRDPVTIAIGTEGTAPVLARRVKAEIEA
ncbi:MAG: bifunctional precorrin-2 dehydrogenase/sirohydrochlorin ferrochelatase, partial [Rhodobiaceae bacterium]|nr:bifunctional precorrin-2 dehydrogenase/sirohydrochlorin ferrochelatase [Rhodobiaceae bacterium]